MNFLDYKELAARTCLRIGDTMHDGSEYTEKKHFAHMMAGIITEFGEIVDLYKKRLAYGKPFDESKLYDEYGDWGWYIRNLLYQREPHELDPEKFSVEFGGYKDFSDDEIIMKLESFLFDITDSEYHVYYSWRFVGHILGLDYEKAMDLNIEKLKVRFPDKFDTRLAIEKNTENEDRVFKNEL